MKKRRPLPSIYLDTTVFSMLHFRGNDIQCIYRRIKTQDWWSAERENFALYTSRVTADELMRGTFRYQQAACSEAHRMNFFPLSRAVQDYAAQLIGAKLVPAHKTNDALQLAFAVVNEVDYLLSWNYAHLANPNVQRMLEAYTERWKLKVPLLVTPESIPQRRLGEW